MFSRARAMPLILGLIIGMGIGTVPLYAYYSASVTDLQVRLEELRTVNTKLTAERSEVQSGLTKAIDNLSNKDRELSSARADLDKLRQELDTATKKILTAESTKKDLGTTVESLKKDRKLLISLRGDSGETRQSNLQYWNEIRSLAGEVSSSLAVTIDGIVTRINSVFDILDKRPAATAACNETLDWQNNVLIASIDLGQKIDQFLDEFYLVVTEHIVKVSDLVET